MGNLLADIRYAVRVLRHARGFTVAVVAILALGIGANSAVFSALDQTAIRPLPYPDSDRLAMLSEDFSAFGMPKNRVSPATFFDWQRRTHAFAGLSALRLAAMNLAESGAPEQLLGAAVTANLLPLLGVQPAMGRVLSPDEEPPGHRVVVLSERLWRRLGADPTAAGRAITLSGEPYTIVGVMPAGFHFPDARTDFWVPIGWQPAQRTARNSHYLRVVGRLRDGVSWPAARDDMREIARQLAGEFPRTNAGIGIVVTPLKEEVTADAGRALTILLGAAACVLLITCANVANLLLARASGRRREIAVRLAVGAARARIVRQLLTESCVLAAAGGAAGLLVARWAVAALGRFVPPALSATIDLHLDARALVFTVAATMFTALLFGAAPALQSVSRDVADNLKPAGGGASGGRTGAGLRQALVVGEIAIALVLLAAAALLIDSLVRLRAVDGGFRADHVLTAEVVVPYPKYADAGRRRRFYGDVVARLRDIPGVERVGLTSDLPYTSRSNYMSLKIEGQTVSGGIGQDALFRLVSAEYLQTIGATLRAGRFLDDGDRTGATPVVVVNEALARQYWPGESALGHRIDTGTGDGAPLWMTIVGVVADIKERGLDFGEKPAVYVPFTQTTIAFFEPSAVAVRTRVAPLELANSLRRAVWSIDAEQPVTAVRSMDDIVDAELDDRHQMLSLLGAFAFVALVLGAMGIYGMLAYVVADRRREIGLRIAIGATPQRVVRDILAQAARLTAVGIGVGLAAAAATTRWLGSLLFGVSPVDPMVLTVVAVVLAATSMLASFLPARRAASVDPMLALRSD